jgi:cysteine-rich repeat protein
MNKNRALSLMTLLAFTVFGCISLPDVDSEGIQPPDTEDPTPDAGPPDAGPPDAGLPDGGPPDAGNVLCGNGNIEADQGEVCDDRNTSAGDGCSADCRSDETCGNGIRDLARNEACDDGNTTTEVSCPYGMASCIRCNSTCTQELALAGYYCGDGITNAPTEVCDDGNTTTEVACPYGTASCVRCDASCSQSLNLTGPYCGDNVRNGSEACDDGNTTTENTCSYGTATCSACNSTCTQTVSLAGPYCGDGIQNGPEGCDDGNASACGSCNATCSQSQLVRATGLIVTVPVASFRDGETLILDDGIHPAVTFEFDKNQQVAASHVQIGLDNIVDAGEVAWVMENSINGIGNALQITAATTTNEDGVSLIHDLAGTFGNRPISENVASSGFRVSGMSGGAGRDCAQGTRCTQDADCQPNLVCNSSRVCGLP